MKKIEIQDKDNKVFFGVKNGLIGHIIYISPFDSEENYIEIDRFQTHIATDGMVFDYRGREEDEPHLYQKIITIDKLHDSIDDYIQVEKPESEEQDEINR